MAETISEERALAVAQKFMKSNRSKHRNLVRWNGIRQNTNDGKYRSQEPYYIFTNSDSIGFVIVAGDDLARPILGYSADARLGDKDNLPLGMQDWLNDIERQISAAQSRQASPSEDVARQWAAPPEGNVLKVHLPPEEFKHYVSMVMPSLIMPSLITRILLDTDVFRILVLW